MGIGDWGLGIGDWAQSPIPNPQYQKKNFILYNLKAYKFIFKIINIKIYYKKYYSQHPPSNELIASIIAQIHPIIIQDVKN